MIDIFEDLTDNLVDNYNKLAYNVIQNSIYLDGNISQKPQEDNAMSSVGIENGVLITETIGPNNYTASSVWLYHVNADFEIKESNRDDISVTILNATGNIDITTEDDILIIEEKKATTNVSVTIGSGSVIHGSIVNCGGVISNSFNVSGSQKINHMVVQEEKTRVIIEVPVGTKIKQIQVTGNVSIVKL